MKDVSEERVALNRDGVGYMMLTSQAEKHAAPHWTVQRRRPRPGVTSWRSVRAIVTCFCHVVQ